MLTISPIKIVLILFDKRSEVDFESMMMEGILILADNDGLVMIDCDDICLVFC